MKKTFDKLMKRWVLHTHDSSDVGGLDSVYLRLDGGNSSSDIATIKQFSIVVEYPTAAEDIAFAFDFGAITITEVQAVVKGSSTPSVTIDPYHTLDRSGGGAENDILDAATAITGETTGQNLTDFDDPTIPADSWIVLKTTAQSGVVEQLTVIIKFTTDDA